MQIFANREDQRSWIIEEILSSLIKLSDSNKKAGQFRLRDGRTIRTVSALLLQLVQTSAHDVRLQATKITRNRQKVFALRRQESSQDVTAEPFLDENDTEVRSLDFTKLLEPLTLPLARKYDSTLLAWSQHKRLRKPLFFS